MALKLVRPEFDLKGHLITVFNGSYVCNNFNESVCTYLKFKFLHGCSFCKDPHPKFVRPRRFSSKVLKNNECIPFEHFSLYYTSVDNNIQLIKLTGQGAWLAKADITIP